MLRTPRITRNPQKIQQGKTQVLSLLTNVALRCNGTFAISLGSTDQEFMDCKASVFAGGQEAVAEGKYESVWSTHAEMNALAAYLDTATDFSAISKIEISAPPCKSCAVVLELLGVLKKVSTTGNIYKNATSSWKWPDKLKDPNKFDPSQWGTIKTAFAGSGLSEAEILEAVVGVIQSQAAY